MKEKQPGLTKTAFLKSESSGGLQYNISCQNLFPKKLKEFNEGQLQETDVTRLRPIKYYALEKKLIAYVDARSQMYQTDKCGISWIRLKARSKQWAKNLGLQAFKCSDGWIDDALKQYGRERVKLHGEGNDIAPEKEAALMGPWLEDFHKLLDDKNIISDCVYNADQTGLYHQNLPNTLYVKKEAKKETRGCKQMKDKTRMTLMVFTVASGKKVPLAVVGKSKAPKCFEVITPPLPYTNQRNAWFDKDITIWWIDNVLFPYHDEQHGLGVPCILLLDNCSAHKLSDEKFVVLEERNILVHFLPSNLTSKRQPADMGMIASLKVGYKTLMLNQLLDIFDEEGKFGLAGERRKQQTAGCKGLAFGGKATVLDAMKILHAIWSNDRKYATEAGINRCWRKVDILPPELKEDVNNDVGSNYISEKDKRIRDYDCELSCNLMKKIQMKTTSARLDTSITYVCFLDSFADDPDNVHLE